MSDVPNIAVIVLDTLRYDAFEEYFDWLPGRRFENAWSPSHWTLPVHAALYTGRYPSEIGVHAERPYLDVDDAVLAESLQDAGYTTVGYTCNTVVSDPFGFDRGFDSLERIGHQNQKVRHRHDSDLFDWSAFIRAYHPEEARWKYGLGLWKVLTSDCDTVRSLRYGFNLKFDVVSRVLGDEDNDMGAQRVLRHLQDRDTASPEFLYLNLMETHTPYQIPESYKEIADDAIQFPSNPVHSLDTDEEIDVDNIKTRYRNAARYLSDTYQDIFAELHADYDYIITFADHGELLGEYGHLAHGYGVYPELTHIPLTVYSGQDDTTYDSRLVSLLDIHRTVLDLAGIDATDSRGRNLLDDDLEAAGVDTEFLTEYHGIPFPSNNQEKLHEWAARGVDVDVYQEWRRGLVLPGYYGFDTIEGFVEQGIAPEEDPQAKIEAIIETFDAVPRNVDDTEISTGVEEKLEDLGYIA